MDLILSTVALVLAAPLMLLIGALVLIALGRPVLFYQERSGLHGRPFRIVKFRTMRNCTHSEHLLSDGARLTSLGRVLRGTSLDELPEFWNVLVGEMSLVGPRPLLMEYLPLYAPEQARRHEVRPGITGWAQVNGRNALSWEERFKLDVWYVDHRSSALDPKIMLLTVLKVLRRHDISHPGHATMERFQGTSASAA